jgi:hypothetical protein
VSSDDGIGVGYGTPKKVLAFNDDKMKLDVMQLLSEGQVVKLYVKCAL